MSETLARWSTWRSRSCSTTRHGSSPRSRAWVSPWPWFTSRWGSSWDSCECQHHDRPAGRRPLGHRSQHAQRRFRQRLPRDLRRRVRSVPGVQRADNLIVWFTTVALPGGAKESVIHYGLEGLSAMDSLERRRATRRTSVEAVTVARRLRQAPVRAVPRRRPPRISGSPAQGDRQDPRRRARSPPARSPSSITGWPRSLSRRAERADDLHTRQARAGRRRRKPWEARSAAALPLQ